MESGNDTRHFCLLVFPPPDVMYASSIPMLEFRHQMS